MMGNLQIQSVVREVTLFEDRAKVTRTLSADLPAGPSTIEIPDVAPVISDATLSASLRDGSGLSFGSTSVRRFMKDPAAKRADGEELRKRIDTARREMDDLSDRLEGIDRAADSRRRVLELMAKEIPEDVASGRDVDEGMRKRWEDTDRQLADLALERVEVESAMEDLQATLRDLAELQSVQWTPSAEYGASILLDVVVDESDVFAIDVEYTVPCACWRPCHRASRSSDQLRFETEAAVWQNTGEDWDDAALTFSTHRPSLGTRPPLLRDDRISVTRRAKEDVVEIRDEVVQDTGLGGGGPAGGPAASGGSQVPGVDDGGVVRLFQARSPMSVPSDGRPHRVSIGAFETRLTGDLIATPELTPFTFISTTQGNDASYPILAGPVDLVSEGEFIGRTRILYTAPGERFKLGWGPDPHVRIHRSAATRHREAGALNPWDRMEYHMDLRVSNIGTEKRSLTLRERIPVSEIEKVRIKCDPADCSDGMDGPDPDGFVQWRLDLEGSVHRSLTLVYTMETHKNVAGV